MWQALKQKIVQINTATGVEISFLENGAACYKSVTLKVNGGALRKEQVGHAVPSIGELSCKKDVPVSVVFTGKGVLVKKVQGELLQQEALATVLPQANPEDFYIRSESFEGFTVVAVARRELIDQELSKLEASGFTVLQVNLGMTSITPLLPHLTSEEPALIIGPYRLTTAQGKLIDFSLSGSEPPALTDKTEYLISGQYIQALHLLAYATAMGLIVDDLRHTENNPTKIVSRREDYIYYKYFKATAVCFLVFLFAGLLINFLFYQHYFSRNKELLTTQTGSQQTLYRLKTLTEEVQRKEKFLSELGWGQETKTSFYADRFASFLPEDMWLTSLQFYPLKSMDYGEQTFSFKKDTVLLSGTCTDAAQINTFINNIKTLENVTQASLKNYTYKKTEQTGVFSLEIVIQ